MKTNFSKMLMLAAIMFTAISLVIILFNVANIQYTTFFGYDIAQDFCDFSGSGPSMDNVNKHWSMVKGFFTGEINIVEAVRILTWKQLCGNIAVVCIPIFIVSATTSVICVNKDRKQQILNNHI